MQGSIGNHFESIATKSGKRCHNSFNRIHRTCWTRWGGADTDGMGDGVQGRAGDMTQCALEHAACASILISSFPPKHALFLSLNLCLSIVGTDPSRPTRDQEACPEVREKYHFISPKQFNLPSSAGGKGYDWDADYR